jgi:hypothetical protein
MRLAIGFLLVSVVAPVARADNSQEVAAAVKMLASKKTDERVKGCEALGKMGDGSKPALEHLCKAAVDDNSKVKGAALDAIRKVDKQAFGWLTRDPLDVIQISREGDKAAHMKWPVIKYIVRMSNPQTKQDRIQLQYAVECVYKIAPKDPDVGTVIISGLWSPVSDFCWKALPNLPNARDAVPDIIKKTDSATVGKHAPVLARLSDKDNRSAIEKCLKSHAKHPDAVTRGIVTDALEHIAKQAEEKK